MQKRTRPGSREHAVDRFDKSLNLNSFWNKLDKTAQSRQSAESTSQQISRRPSKSSKSRKSRRWTRPRPTSPRRCSAVLTRNPRFLAYDRAGALPGRSRRCRGIYWIRLSCLDSLKGRIFIGGAATGSLLARPPPSTEINQSDGSDVGSNMRSNDFLQSP